LLRYDVATDSFDDYYVDLTTLTGGGVAGSLLTGPDGQPYLLSLDDTGYAGPPVARVLASSPFWTWNKLTVGDTPTLDVVDGNPNEDGTQSVVTGGSVIPVDLGDDIVLPLLEGRDATHFAPFTSEGPGESTRSIIGLAFSTVKLN